MDGTRLANALVVVEGGEARRPAVVVVSACDGGNQAARSSPARVWPTRCTPMASPYVLASQFPLTEEGSVALVNDLYPRLFCGEDPRCALYHLRQVLANNPDVHDWASLVAYARFPEDLGVQLESVRLAAVLEAMKTGNAWADHALKHREKIENTFSDVSLRLDKAIQDLEHGVEGVGNHTRATNAGFTHLRRNP